MAGFEWEITTVKTLTVDAHKRIRIRDANPGEVFACTDNGDGSITLRKVEPVHARPAKVRIEKRGGFSVGVLDRPISEAALKEALDEFP
jgi:hypothetical protein